jgi:hypothetical protein
MERWQSLYEHRVPTNLAESGVHPVSLNELVEISEDEGLPTRELFDEPLGYGQTNGTDELRARIAALHPGSTEDQVLVTLGGAEANFLSLWELAEGQPSGAVLMPTYMQAPGLMRSWDIDLHEVPLVEATDWQPDLDVLDSALDAGSGFIVVTNPNNPVGVSLTDASEAGLVESSERHGAWILSDEVYRGAELEEAETGTLSGRTERTLVTGSLSKAYGLPGLRLGWAVGPEREIARLWARSDYTTIGPPWLSDGLARMALHPGVRTRLKARTRGILRENLTLVEEWLGTTGDEVSARSPDAGAIVFLRVHHRLETADIAERLRVDHGVLVVPGEHFERPGWLRIGFGTQPSILEAGLGAISDLLEGS